MNEHIIKIIEAEYKQYGLYDIKIKKYFSSGHNLYVFLDVIHRRNGTTSHGYSKRAFYDYLSDSYLRSTLANYFYDTKREDIPKAELMQEEGIIVIGTIELKRIKKDGHITKYYPLLITSKSPFSTTFNEYIVKSANEIGVAQTFKELNSAKGLKISKATIYNLLKK